MKNNTEKFFELDREFNRNLAKFNWWNGVEFGTILGGIVCLFISPIHYWILFCAFCIEFMFALHYQRRGKKILNEMKELTKQDK